MGDKSVNHAILAFLVERRSRGLSPQTIRFYKNELTWFEKWLNGQGVTTIERVTSDVIRGYLLSLTTRNKGGHHVAFRSIKAWLSWYYEETDQIDKNPIAKVKAPENKIKPLPGVPIAEVRELASACDGAQGIRDRAIIVFLVDTGVRAGELCALDIKSVDQLTGYVVVRSGKGDKQRTVFLGKSARRVLRAYLKTRDGASENSPLFVSGKNERMTVNGLRLMVIRRAQQAKIKAPGLHDFRRCFALEMRRHGVDNITLSRLMGHSSLEVLKRYLAQDDGDYKAAHGQGSPVDHWG